MRSGYWGCTSPNPSRRRRLWAPSKGRGNWAHYATDVTIRRSAAAGEASVQFLSAFFSIRAPASAARNGQLINDAYHRATLHSVALWCTAFGRPPFGSGRQGTRPMRFWVISQFARLRIGDHLNYSLVRGSESMPPASAAPETWPLAPDHTGGNASDVSLGPRSGCRA
jgi:hypothetical protein